MRVSRCFLDDLTLQTLLLFMVVASDLNSLVTGLGSMSSIAISYGENGAAFCGLRSDGSHFVTCYGSNPALIGSTPTRARFTGLTGGNGFVCGLLENTRQPFCWGVSEFVAMGVPKPMAKFAEFVELSAGDHHLCGLRKPLTGNQRNYSVVDCWGYNMTKSHVFDGPVQSVSAGSEFNCGLFSENRTAFCWGDETSSGVISRVPSNVRFKKISAGGYHVCGIMEGIESNVSCWGTSWETQQEIAMELAGQDPGRGQVNFDLTPHHADPNQPIPPRGELAGQVSVDLTPSDAMLSVVGGRFHACGIISYNRTVVCWGFRVARSTEPPKGVRVYEIAAGDYFSCGVVADKSFTPVCWGAGFPASLPLAVSPVVCQTNCEDGFYEYNNSSSPCKSPGSKICLPCSHECPSEMYKKSECTKDGDRICEYNCSNCTSVECSSNCSYSDKKTERFWSLQLPVIVGEIVFGVLLVIVVTLTAIFYVRYKLRNCNCSTKGVKIVKNGFQKDGGKIQPDLEELKIRRARVFSYDELEKATGGFMEESQVGKGSFSCVFKGILKDGVVVAVKRAILSPDMKKNSMEFHNELDLLSRLNHAHLLNLLGYCEEGEQRLLVYEFMANGSLHQHLHGNPKALKSQLDWVKRVTIAVQAARGIEYLHGYACPPVIHRDIKSSNILIDEEHNARVADFGLSLLGPANSSSPLAELPAGTLGYLDPEYYRLHYLTTKSDVYSFGVLLLEILSGRKAIDMKFEEGNIVEWAVPLIKAGEIHAILDPALTPPSDLEALKRIANVACKCVRMRGKERPSMDKVTTALERALAMLMGSPSNDQPILPTEVVLGSSRMHKKSSQRSSNRSELEGDVAVETEDQRIEFRAPSWITFPSVASSQRRKSSVSEVDVVDPKVSENKHLGDGLRSLEEEIGPASPQEHMFLQHNF
ncbi:hypothetical protein L1887_32536 [Cichorium endivia]|nr:hypothetical protein L1887_32536 [Cichorium endivia]